MDIERLISEAPLLAAVVFIVSLFIRYLGKRDQELRHIVELFNDRVARLAVLNGRRASYRPETAIYQLAVSLYVCLSVLTNIGAGSLLD